MTTFNEIAYTATQPKRGWSNAECAKFHYFNPNGLCAQKKATDKQIDKLIDAGKAKGGAAIAYGCLNYRYPDQIAELSRKKRVSKIDLFIATSGIKDSIESAKKFIAEMSGE